MRLASRGEGVRPLSVMTTRVLGNTHRGVGNVMYTHRGVGNVMHTHGGVVSRTLAGVLETLRGVLDTLIGVLDTLGGGGGVQTHLDRCETHSETGGTWREGTGDGRGMTATPGGSAIHPRMCVRHVLDTLKWVLGTPGWALWRGGRHTWLGRTGRTVLLAGGDEIAPGSGTASAATPAVVPAELFRRGTADEFRRSCPNGPESPQVIGDTTPGVVEVETGVSGSVGAVRSCDDKPRTSLLGGAAPEPPAGTSEFHAAPPKGGVRDFPERRPCSGFGG